jgi:hypothetical protein
MLSSDVKRYKYFNRAFLILICILSISVIITPQHQTGRHMGLRKTIRAIRSAIADFPTQSKPSGNKKATVESLEERVLFSGFALSSGNLTFNGSLVSQNVISFQTGRSGFAYFAVWGGGGPAGEEDLAISTANIGGGIVNVGQVYNYGVVNNDSPEPTDGYCYYWLVSNGDLMLNTDTSNINISGTPIQSFGAFNAAASSTGPAWSGAYYLTGSGSTGSLLFNSLQNGTESTAGTTTTIATNVLALGVEAPTVGGTAYYRLSNGNFDSVVGTSPTVIDSSAKGFGMSSNGSAYYWDTATNNLMLTPGPGTAGGLIASSVGVFGTDAAGNAYYMPANTSNVICSSFGGNGYTSGLKESTAIASTFSDTPLVATAPGYGSVVSYEVTAGALDKAIFEPIYGIESTNGSTTSPNMLLGNVPVYLIYWGSYWNGTPSPSSASLTSTVNTLYSGTYLNGLSLAGYGVTGTAHVAGTFIYTGIAAPGSGGQFTDATLQSVVQNVITANGLPQDNFGPGPKSYPLYFVITQPGVSSSSAPTAASYHSAFNVVLQSSGIAYGWIGSSSSTLDGYTSNLGHETAEAITDPFLGAGGGWTTVAGGLFDPGHASLLGVSEIADWEAQFYGARISGILVQSYWSIADQAYMVLL